MGLTLLPDTLTPSDLGLTGYPSFRTDSLGRPVQLEVVEFAAYCEKRFAAVCAPTGIGKGCAALSIAKLAGVRTAILTGTLGLQDQYKVEGSANGLVDIRGRANYSCGDWPELDCRLGSKMGCRYVGGRGCEYDTCKDLAREADIVGTSYAYWMTVHDKAQGLERTGEDAELEGRNPIELLICDEFHTAKTWLAGYIAVRLYEGEVKRWCEPAMMGEDIAKWQQLIQNLNLIDELKTEVKVLALEIAGLGKKVKKQHIEQLHRTEALMGKFMRVMSMRDDWVLERKDGTRVGRVWSFDVIQPGRYAEQYLFCRVPKVVVMSASLRPKEMPLMGIGKDEYEFREWQRIYQRSNCPIYYLPPKFDGKSVRVTQKTDAAQLFAWVLHIDQLMKGRLDRRVLIITSSYKYQEFLMGHSSYGEYMIGNKDEEDSETAQEAFNRFIKTPPPVILCSPSFGVGWDFKDDRCEFLVISKVPLRAPKGASKLMAARLARDPEYGNHETMQDIVQWCGRPQRSETDRAEIVIVDGSWDWFGPRNAKHAPEGFVKEIRRVLALPPAPKKIADR